MNIVDSTDFESEGMNGWENFSSSGSIIGSDPRRYWQGSGSAQFPCGIVKFFNYGDLVAGEPYTITIDFASTSNTGCYVEVATEGVVGVQRTNFSGGSSWATHSFDFSPRVNSSNLRLKITLMSPNFGADTTFSLDNINIIKL
ncbi:hypothetical protein ACQKMW_16230 [Pseudomonas sivasensis]|uniref:hypothetical protein n=1 Tax=Pseudomonas TaxID=286 RepID=UPI0013E0D9AB